MRTIVNQFQMAAPGRQALGQRLLAGGRDVSRPIEVPKSAAPGAWFGARYSAHGVIAPATPWMLGQGNGLSGFAEGTDVVGPNLNLNFGAAENATDFFGTNEAWLRAIATPCGLDPRYSATTSYAPAPRSLADDAAAKWRKLYLVRATNSAVNELMVSAQANINSALGRIAQMGGTNFDILCGKRSLEIELQRIGAFEEVKRELARIVTFVIPVNAALTQSDEALAQQATAAQVAQDAAAHKDAATGASTGPSPYLVFGGIAAVGVLAFILRKTMKKSA